MSRHIAITALFVFAITCIIHMAGYTQLIYQGEVGVIGAVYESKWVIASLIFALYCIGLILTQNNKALYPLIAIFLILPLYNLGESIKHYLIYQEPIYFGYDVYTMTRFFIEKFILSLGIPYITALYIAKSRLEHSASA